MNRAEALSYRKSIEDAAALQSDEKALENIYLYPKWADRLNKVTPQEYGEDILVGERLQDDDKLWKCITAHKALANWKPKDSPSLFVEVSDDEWPEWVQPTGAEDAYNKGDKVTFEGEHYISTIDGNVWSPKDYPAGWEKQ